MAISWMKKGVEAAEAIKKADAEQALKQEQNRKMWRFWLKQGEEARVTFVDGNLTPEGVLDIITYREHTLYMNGSWNNHFVCTSDIEPCPICEGKDQPSLVGAFTIIDHRVTKSNDGTKTYKDQPRLFIAKKDTIKVLQNLAGKRGGLAGCTFDIMRVGEKSPSVGNQFDFIEKSEVALLQKKYTREMTVKDEKTGAEVKKVVTVFVPANYEHEIVFKSAKELREMGMGSSKVIGQEKAPTDTAVGDAPGTSGTKSLESQL